MKIANENAAPQPPDGKIPGAKGGEQVDRGGNSPLVPFPVPMVSSVMSIVIVSLKMWQCAQKAWFRAVRAKIFECYILTLTTCAVF